MLLAAPHRRRVEFDLDARVHGGDVCGRRQGGGSTGGVWPERRIRPGFRADDDRVRCGFSGRSVRGRVDGGADRLERFDSCEWRAVWAVLAAVSVCYRGEAFARTTAARGTRFTFLKVGLIIIGHSESDHLL